MFWQVFIGSLQGLGFYLFSKNEFANGKHAENLLPTRLHANAIVICLQSTMTMTAALDDGTHKPLEPLEPLEPVLLLEFTLKV